uniref:Protein TSSC4 n=1 Tax=Rhabditophanes sp. KR3021 TaxID=114890 RepID=A0AC35UDR7_9BILA
MEGLGCEKHQVFDPRGIGLFTAEAPRMVVDVGTFDPARFRDEAPRRRKKVYRKPSRWEEYEEDEDDRGGRQMPLTKVDLSISVKKIKNDIVDGSVEDKKVNVAKSRVKERRHPANSFRSSSRLAEEQAAMAKLQLGPKLFDLRELDRSTEPEVKVFLRTNLDRSTKDGCNCRDKVKTSTNKAQVDVVDREVKVETKNLTTTMKPSEPVGVEQNFQIEVDPHDYDVDEDVEIKLRDDGSRRGRAFSTHLFMHDTRQRFMKLGR